MRYLIAVILSFFLAGPALAYHCPSLMKDIDNKLSTHDYDDATREQVMALRQEGEALHRQGKHGDSVRVLEEALEKLEAAGQ